MDRSQRVDMLLECALFECEELPWRGPGWGRSLTRHGTHIGGPRPLSTTGDGMLLVLEAMQKRGYMVELTVYPDGAATCKMRHFATPRRDAPDWVDAPGAPGAVVLAALKALGVEVREGDDGSSAAR